MPTLYFSKEYEDLVKELCTKSARPDLDELFPRYRDLMLFAAMVGKQEGRIAERTGNGGEVESNYFKSAGFNKEGVIYLIGLLDTSNPDVLKGGAPECWKRFESYCNGGMEIIKEWLSATEDPEEYSDILRTRLLEMAKATKTVKIKVKKPKLPRVT
jgi:dnd system-associated protein 4